MRGRPKRPKKRTPIFVDLRNDKRIEGALSDYLRDQLPAIGKGPAVAKLASERLRELYPARFADVS